MKALKASPLLALLVAAACSSTTTPAAPTTCASPGGAVAGAADTHCAGPSQSTSQAACHPDAGAPVDSGMNMDAMVMDAAMDDGSAAPMFGATLFNAEGDDDDCKYHVKWSATPVCEGTGGVTFTVTATKKVENTPLTGAGPYIEAFLSDTHPAPKSGSAKETAPGVYTIGPVVFDAPGQWTVRFHFYGDCADDLADSPHGHAAFFVKVP